MGRLVFLLEEHSMKVLLDGLLPRLLPNSQFLCVPHEGKQDLEKSIPRKLRAWDEPGVRFVVVRDNDGSDCEDLKRRLVALCASARPTGYLVRIAVQELEAWYIGQLDGVAQAFEDPSIERLSAKARYRDPDAVARPSEEMKRVAPRFQKVSGARLMARFLSADTNRSRSFHVFVSGLQRLAQEMYT
jgi:hypothetical protein